MIFLFVVKSRREVLWSSLFVSAGLIVGAVFGISPMLKTFGLVPDKNDLCVVVDAGHQDLAYTLNRKNEI